MGTNSSAFNEYLRRADPGLSTERTTAPVSDLTEDHSRREHMKMVLTWQGWVWTLVFLSGLLLLQELQVTFLAAESTSSPKRKSEAPLSAWL